MGGNEIYFRWGRKDSLRIAGVRSRRLNRKSLRRAHDKTRHHVDGLVRRRLDKPWVRKAGKLPFDRFVTRYPFDKINEAIADGHHGKCIKPVLVFD